MKRKLLFLCLMMLSLIGLSAFRSDDPILTLLKKLEEFTKKYPSEKVYLHLDKPYYAAGDNIWFKAYVTDWKTGELTPLSTILYVELINQNNGIEKKIQLPMQNGLTWGDFKLTDTLSEGNYRIRAYTRWMRNAGPNFFFDKTIKIGSSWAHKVFTKTQFSSFKKDNSDLNRATMVFTDQNNTPIAGKMVTYHVGTLKGSSKTNAEGKVVIDFPNKQGNVIVNIDTDESGKVQKVIPIKLATAAVDIQFLPEGGTLLEGIRGKIAVKAIGTNGLGLKVKGTVVDQSGEEITTFETSELGMGSFLLIPEPNKTYTAKMGGTAIQLPKAKTSGYTLAFNQIDSAKFMATVKISRDLMNKGELYLVGQKNGNAFSAIKLTTVDRTNEVIYENKEFPQGIIQFTLFSPSNLPVCERLVFVANPANDIQIDLKQLKPNYQKREKAAFSLFSSLNSKPVPASFSVAITNADAVIHDLENESNIMANLLLTSDLIGYVEKPNTYFLNKDKKTVEALDHLMLTQGWRKIEWKTISDDQFPVIAHEVEKGLKISGVITKKSVPLPRSTVSLINNKEGLFKLDTVSNDKGEFTFENLEYTDATKFILQARSEANKKEVQIEIKRPETEEPVTARTQTNDLEVNINQTISTYLGKSTPYFEELTKQGLLSKTQQLKEVRIEGTRPNPAPNSLNLNGAGNADYVVDASQLELANSVAQYLQGRVPSVTIRNGIATSQKNFKRRGPRRIIVNGRVVTPEAANGATLDTAMHIVLDGMDMGTDFNLNDLNPQTIESIEVLTSLPKLAIYGANASNGLFIVTSKKGGALTYTPVKYAPGVTTFTPKGYYVARNFYSPKYDVEPNDKPDLRTTVFWMPNLVTDDTGNITFDYFNTDQPGNYRMVIEGIDINGNIARKTYTYKVD